VRRSGVVAMSPQHDRRSTQSRRLDRVSHLGPWANQRASVHFACACGGWKRGVFPRDLNGNAHYPMFLRALNIVLNQWLILDLGLHRLKVKFKLCAECGGDEKSLSALGAHDGTDEVKAQSVAGAFVGAS